MDSESDQEDPSSSDESDFEPSNKEDESESDLSSDAFEVSHSSASD